MSTYYILRFWIGGSLRVWFRKIYARFEADLPENVPIIFACTHPNSAVDYTFLPLITRKKSFVMVRGDVFKNKFLNSFFRWMWMLPVYRMRDGFSSLNKNTDSFRECFAEFDTNGRTLIFSEGTSIQEKSLQSLKKGTARLALDYLATGDDKEIYVVPMANNYSKFRQFRGTVMTSLAAPIKVSEYKPLFAESPAKAYNKLTEDIHTSLNRVFIGVTDYADDCWTERALNVLRFNRLDPRKEWIIEDGSIFDAEKKLVDTMNSKDVLSDDWKARYDALEVDEELEGILKRSGRKDVQAMTLFSLALIVALGNVVHFLPEQLSRWFVRNKIKDILFENTIITIGSGLFYLFQFLIASIILSAFLGWAGFVIVLATLAVSAIYSEIIDDFRFAWKTRGRLKNRDAYKLLYNDLIESINKA
jgi:1-acyl-sn-glycerol-3-phosphate acyltransferase